MDILGRGHPFVFKVYKYKYKLIGIQSNTTYNVYLLNWLPVSVTLIIIRALA